MKETPTPIKEYRLSFGEGGTHQMCWRANRKPMLTDSLMEVLEAVCLPMEAPNKAEPSKGDTRILQVANHATRGMVPLTLTREPGNPDSWNVTLTTNLASSRVGVVAPELVPNPEDLNQNTQVIWVTLTQKPTKEKQCPKKQP